MHVSVSTHSRPKAAGTYKADINSHHAVSTHSRPKAAGCICAVRFEIVFCFNTQPPEGGWKALRAVADGDAGFNTQPPEGGWQLKKIA